MLQPELHHNACKHPSSGKWAHWRVPRLQEARQRIIADAFRRFSLCAKLRIAMDDIFLYDMAVWHSLKDAAAGFQRRNLPVFPFVREWQAYAHRVESLK